MILNICYVITYIEGNREMLIFVVDSLKGFPDAFTATFPATLVQTCIVRPIRQSRNLCCWKDRRAVRSGGS